MDLQEAFYIIGIIFMSLMLILFIALVAVLVIIRSKVAAIHSAIDSKISSITTIPSMGLEVVDKVKRSVMRTKR